MCSFVINYKYDRIDVFYLCYDLTLIFTRYLLLTCDNVNIQDMKIVYSIKSLILRKLYTYIWSS